MPVTAVAATRNEKGDTRDTNPANNATAITKSDTDELAKFSRALYVGGAGDVTVILQKDTVAVTFVAVPAGTILPIAVKQLKSTGTSATDIVALY